jgi:hypothetical protein
MLNAENKPFKSPINMVLVSKANEKELSDLLRFGIRFPGNNKHAFPDGPKAFCPRYFGFFKPVRL